MNNSSRKEVIQSILSDLNSLKSNSNYVTNEYAIEQNIIFFKAIKSITSYLYWLFFKTHKILSNKLLELTDFPFAKWDIEMHKELILIEKNKFPGLINPLVKGIANFCYKKDRDLTIADFGSGGMELERQVITLLENLKFINKIIFIAIDKSDITHNLARHNIENVTKSISFYNAEILTNTLLEKIKKETITKYTIIQCKNDIFHLKDQFSNRIFDLVVHTLFKHHLNSQQKKDLDILISKLGCTALEYDGYKSWFQIIPQTLISWKNPVLLNGSVLSGLRYEHKKNIKYKAKNYNNYKLEFFKIGTYLLQYTNN